MEIFCNIKVFILTFKQFNALLNKVYFKSKTKSTDPKP